ncbi:unnamed protein product [Closterium sp. NIES-64]|nr:unnamed protein product [Closterium sp. NIES-64]
MSPSPPFSPPSPSFLSPLPPFPPFRPLFALSFLLPLPSLTDLSPLPGLPFRPLASRPNRYASPSCYSASNLPSHFLSSLLIPPFLCTSSPLPFRQQLVGGSRGEIKEEWGQEDREAGRVREDGGMGQRRGVAGANGMEDGEERGDSGVDKGQEKGKEQGGREGQGEGPIHGEGGGDGGKDRAALEQGKGESDGVMGTLEAQMTALQRQQAEVQAWEEEVIKRIAAVEKREWDVARKEKEIDAKWKEMKERKEEEGVKEWEKEGEEEGEEEGDGVGELVRVSSRGEEMAGLGGASNAKGTEVIIKDVTADKLQTNSSATVEIMKGVTLVKAGKGRSGAGAAARAGGGGGGIGSGGGGGGRGMRHDVMEALQMLKLGVRSLQENIETVLHTESSLHPHAFNASAAFLHLPPGSIETATPAAGAASSSPPPPLTPAAAAAAAAAADEPAGSQAAAAAPKASEFPKQYVREAVAGPLVIAGMVYNRVFDGDYTRFWALHVWQVSVAHEYGTWGVWHVGGMARGGCGTWVWHVGGMARGGCGTWGVWHVVMARGGCDTWWLEYHRYAGVTRFYWYDEARSTEEDQDVVLAPYIDAGLVDVVLAPYIDAGLVVYHRVREMPFVGGNFTDYLERMFRCKQGAAYNHWVQVGRDLDGGRLERMFRCKQGAAYNHWVKHYASEVHWGFHTDIDEYFFSPAGTPPGFLRHYLQTLPKTTIQVLIQNVFLLGDSISPDTDTLLERYTLRMPNSSQLLPTPLSTHGLLLPRPIHSQVLIQNVFFLGDPIGPDTDTLLERYTLRMPNSSQRHRTKPIAWLPLAVHLMDDCINPHEWAVMENGPPKLVDMEKMRLNHYWGDRAGVISDTTPVYTMDVTMMDEYGDGLVKDDSAKVRDELAQGRDELAQGRDELAQVRDELAQGRDELEKGCVLMLMQSTPSYPVAMGVWLRQRMQVAWAVISAQAVHKERKRLRKRVAEVKTRVRQLVALVPWLLKGRGGEGVRRGRGGEGGGRGGGMKGGEEGEGGKEREEARKMEGGVSMEVGGLTEDEALGEGGGDDDGGGGGDMMLGGNLMLEVQRRER